MDAELLEFNGEDDHVHLIVSCPPKLAVANLSGKITLSTIYYAVSCEGASLEIVKKYIDNQRRPSEEKNIKKSISFTKNGPRLTCP